MALDSYSELTTAIGTWTERTYTSGQTDEFILLAEAAANRKLRQDFRRRASATITTDSDGLATLPTGFIGMTSLVRGVTGSLPLVQVSWDALITRNPYADADDALVYAIYGTTLRVSPVVAGDFTAVFSKVLTGLSASNTTNWLLTLAPDYYLFGCRAAQCAFEEDESRATFYSNAAAGVLDDLIAMGNVAEFGNAEVTLAQAP